MPLQPQIRLHGERFLRRLPARVAHCEGFFEAEGLRVEWVEPDPVREAVEPLEWRKRIKESLLEQGRIHVYKVCQWGGIQRAWQGQEARIFAVEGSISGGMHAIFAHPASRIETPTDLAGTAVGVSRETGSFYRVLETLEEHLPSGSIRTVHAGAPLQRFRRLLAGELAAAEFMDLLVPLAEIHGLRKVLDEPQPRPGVLMAHRSIPPGSLRAFMRAWNRGAERINASPDHYARQAVSDLLERVPASLRVPGEALERSFRMPVFAAIRPYGREEFSETRDWMLRRGLIAGKVGYRQVVVTGLEP